MKSIKINLSFKWYDVWMGAYIDIKNKAIYICIISCIVIKLYRSNTVKCPYCNNGRILRLVNSEGFHFNNEEPIEEEESCEECGGTGELPEDIKE